MRLDIATEPVPLKAALEVLWAYGKEQGIPAAKMDALAAYVSSLPQDEDGCVPRDKLVGILRNLHDAIRLTDPKLLTQPRGFWWPNVPDVIEAAESEEYANKKQSLWTSTQNNLWQIHHNTETMDGPYFYRHKSDGSPPCIIVITGSQGGGKSETTVLSGYYTLLLLLMMHNPHLEFRQDPGSWIIFAFQGLKKASTEDSLYDKFTYCVDHSPWIQKYAPRRADYNAELRWPDRRIKVINLTGIHDAGLGKDIFFAGLSEVNEMPVYEKSKRLKNTDKTVLNVGEEMFDVISNRIETRFSQLGGGFPGKLIVDSARAYVGDFSDTMKENAKHDGNILIIEKPLWVAKAHEYPADEPRFLVEKSDGKRPARIIETIEQALEPELVIEVPARHRARFDKNLENALKYFVGEPPTSTGRFINQPESITRAQEMYVEMFGDLRPFHHEEISFRDLFGEVRVNQKIDWSILINYKYFEQILDKTVAFAVHADSSISGDATGLAFGRVIGGKEIAHGQIWNAEHSVLQEFEAIEAPVYVIDGILRIVARPGEIIDINLVQALVLELKRLIKIRYGSADWFESWQMIINWRKAGIVADKYSVDKKPDGYFEAKFAMADERVYLCPHSTCDKEFRLLKRSVQNAKVKIDHPEGGSKDCSDSVAGVIGVLYVTDGQRYLHEIRAKRNSYDNGDDDDNDDDNSRYTLPKDDAPKGRRRSSDFGESECDDDEEYTPSRRRQSVVTRGGRGRSIF